MTAPLDSAARAELIRRLHLADRKAEVKRRIMGSDEFLFDLQRESLADPSKRKVDLCGRRSGKSEKIARQIVLALLDTPRDAWVLFGALTKGQAKDIIWVKLIDVIDRLNLRDIFEVRESRSSIVTSWGASFRVVGFDDKTENSKIRGYKCTLVALDEVASYELHLKTIIDDVITWTLLDFGGTLQLSGTPGIAKSGLWYRISTGRDKKRWSIHKWNFRQNKKLPRPVDVVERELLEEFGWSREDPAFQREGLGLWVTDDENNVFPLHDDLIVNPSDVDFDRADWVVTIGLDPAVRKDATAWAVVGSHRDEATSYVLWSEKRWGLLPDEVAAHTAHLKNTWGATRLVGDGGGLGATYVTEWNRRWGQQNGLYMSDAIKPRQHVSARMVIDEMRGGRLLFVDNSRVEDGIEIPDPLIDEMRGLVWADERQEGFHPGCPNDATDAMRYASNAHRGYTGKPRPEPVHQVSISEDAKRWEAERVQRAKTTAAMKNMDPFKRFERNGGR